MYCDSFGFLPCVDEVGFCYGRIPRKLSYEEEKEALFEKVSGNGFLYPPVDDEDTSGGNANRPAKAYAWPASHDLEIYNPLFEEDTRAYDGSCVIYLLSYLYGRRLQFSEWLVEGRIPLKKKTHHVIVNERTASSFLEKAYEKWRGLADKIALKRLTNILYMHSKAPAYEWEWEVFGVEYMVLDAIYHFATHVERKQQAQTHAARIETLCGSYGLWYDDQTTRSIVDQRNELFHEALWSDKSPCYYVDREGKYNTRVLRCLNHRLIAAILGWTGEYVRSRWSDLLRMIAASSSTVRCKDFSRCDKKDQSFVTGLPNLATGTEQDPQTYRVPPYAVEKQHETLQGVSSVFTVYRTMIIV